MSKRIETQLVIRGVDKWSSVMRSMQTNTGRFSEKMRAEGKRLQAMRGPLRQIEDFRAQQKAVQGTGAAMEAAREKSRKLLAQIRAMGRPTDKNRAQLTQLRAEFIRARKAQTRLEQSHVRARKTLHGQMQALKEAKVDTANLAAEQDRLTRALSRGNGVMDRQMVRMRQIAEMQARMARARERMDRVLARSANISFAGDASVATGRRILSGLREPVALAVRFESAMADVRKVVDFDSPEALRQMSDDLLKLSGRMPMTAEGLAQIVAAGGQSGLAADELLRFAESAAKVGVAFDISADQSGEAMARVKTALGLTLGETETVFDRINHLSNNMAATAPRVLDFLNRSASAGQTYGFDPGQTLAVGAAMIAAGAQADVASTSFRNMGLALTKGGAATEAQKRAFAVLGLTSEQVAQDMQADAQATVLTILERLAQVPDAARAATISQLFGNEAQAVMPLIGNLDLLRQSFALSANDAAVAGSVQAEYDARQQTTAANLQMTRNRLAALGVTIGEVILPPLNDLLDKVQVLAERWTAWAKEHPRLTKMMVTGAAALGGLAVVGGVLLSASAALVGSLAVLRFGLVGLGARGVLASGSLLSLAGRFSKLAGLAPFRLAKLIKPVKWTKALVSAVPWTRLAGGLTLSKLVVPLVWGARLIPGIGWAVLAGELAWKLLVEPLGWDEYIKDAINWKRLAGGLDWSKLVPVLDWDLTNGVPLINTIKWSLSAGKLAWDALIDQLGWDEFIGVPDWGKVFDFEWPEPPEWIKWLMGQRRGAGPKDAGLSVAPGAPVQPMGGGPWLPALLARDLAGERALGGPVRAGLPYLVNESTPRSEIFVPSQSGGILNVPQAQRVLAGTMGSAARIRSLGMAGLASSALAAPVLAAPATAPPSVRVDVGGITVHVPGQVTDPGRIADMVAERIGDSVTAAARASFSD